MTDKYTLERNHCHCHPETCNCSDYIIFKNKEKYTQVRNKEIGDHIVESLNFLEDNKKGLEGKTEYRKYGCRDQIEIDSRVGGDGLK